MASQVRGEAVVPCRGDRARAHLPARLSANVGVNRWPRPHKRVRARLGVPHARRETSVSSLWWAPTGPWAAFFPALRAGLAITEIDETSCLLVVVGDYTPPLGRAGAVADRVILHRLAAATVQDFTNRLAHALVADVEEGSR